MAFASTTLSTLVGNKRMKYGTFTNAAGDSGGTITTGLSNIEAACAGISSHMDATPPKLAISGGTITLTCEDDSDGWWIAIGI